MTSRPYSIFGLLLAAWFTVIAGCGGDQPGDGGGAADSSAIAATASPDTASGRRASEPPIIPETSPSARVAPGAWATAAVRQRNAVAFAPIAQALRTGVHDDFDRVVIAFDGTEVPGFTVGYVDDPPAECGSGRAVALGGEAVLEIHLEPARGHTEQGSATVDHARQSHGLSAILESDVTCDFEAVLTVALGISKRLPFRVDVLEGPPRLVIDVQHSAP